MKQQNADRTDQALRARIARNPSGRAGYKQLIRELGLGGGQERRLLREQLARLVKSGLLHQASADIWEVPRAPESAANSPTLDESTHHLRAKQPRSSEATFLQGGRARYASGRLELHRDGFGFVRPTTAEGSRRESQDGDIFIPPNALHGAMHGDTVLVDVDAPQRDGRRSGRIARVVSRRNATLVGIFHYGRAPRRAQRIRPGFSPDAGQLSGNYVRPWDDRLAGLIEIPAGAELPLASASSPHRTLGEEMTARPSPLSSTEDPWPLEGMAVEVEITRYPENHRPASGRILEVLGDPEAFGVDVEIVIRKHALPHTFPAHVLAEASDRAASSLDEMSSAEQSYREDFRNLPVVTIDGETARDFDDAVLVRPLGDGRTELQVHIADVSHYVVPASALDTEARVRGTSVYFPDRAVPMLPHALSSGMCSLLPNEDRLVLSCIMVIDDQGEIVSYRVTEGLIRSARRMTYTLVQHCLNASPLAQAWNAHLSVTPPPSAEDQAERDRLSQEQPELPPAFDAMLELALRLNRKRVRRGSIDFDLPEPSIVFDPEGNMQAIVRSERGWAHRLIEEFMLSANECVATWLTAQNIPSLYRIHEMPDPKRILEFEETAASFGQTLGIGAVPVKRLTMKTDRREMQRRSARGRTSGRDAQAHEVPERIPVTPQMYQRLIRRMAGTPEERILSYLMLRSLKQAKYSEKNEGHFALASPCYTHFTSPIRRYPDLIVHRLLRAMLRGGANPHGGSLLSSDPQPWKTEFDRAQGRQAANLSPAPGQPAARRQGSSTEKPRKAHSGRIGWSSDPEEVNLAAMQPSEHGEGTLSVEDAGLREPLSAQELADIAVESSQAERRASDAERELLEWKKMKFMADKVGDHFQGLILSVTKFGFFVELNDFFVEGLVPLASLQGDFYSYRDGDRSICGTRHGHCFKVGDAVEVLLDRIDRQQNRLQFALVPGSPLTEAPPRTSLRQGKTEAKKQKAEARKREKRAGTPKAKKRKKR